MVVLACIKNANVAGTQSDHIGRTDSEHSHRISSSLVSIYGVQICMQ